MISRDRVLNTAKGIGGSAFRIGKTGASWVGNIALQTGVEGYYLGRNTFREASSVVNTAANMYRKASLGKPLFYETANLHALNKLRSASRTRSSGISNFRLKGMGLNRATRQKLARLKTGKLEAMLERHPKMMDKILPTKKITFNEGLRSKVVMGAVGIAAIKSLASIAQYDTTPVYDNSSIHSLGGDGDLAFSMYYNNK